MLLTLDRDGPESLQAQVERQLREGIRRGTLRPGGEMPSTRALSRDLGISRPLVMEAYSQLAAEGYLDLRPGAIPREFGYTQRVGVGPLRQSLADYLGRVRGVSADPRQILITGGFEQARTFLARVLKRRGTQFLAVEEPGYTDREVWLNAGFSLLPIPVDIDGIEAAALAASKAEAVLLTPAHQHPTGAVMSGARRQAVAKWLVERNAVAVEDDYDAEFRYDRTPIGALQGLAPEHVVYAGTTSKTLAPALRLGWLVVPPELLPMLEDEYRALDYS